MAINKVVCNGETLMDITSSTVTEDSLVYGVTAYDARGEKITGTLAADSGDHSKWVADPVNNPLSIPYGTTAIGNELCYLSKGVYSISIPETLETIGERAFQDCPNLAGVVNFKNVKNLGNSAFRGCAKITNILMDGMEVIGPLVFSYCSGLTNVTLPGTIKNVQTGAFKSCTGLKTVTFEKGESASPINGISADAFVGCSALTDIYVYWAYGVAGNAPWNAPSGCKIHYTDQTVTV